MSFGSQKRPTCTYSCFLTWSTTSGLEILVVIWRLFLVLRSICRTSLHLIAIAGWGSPGIVIAICRTAMWICHDRNLRLSINQKCSTGTAKTTT